VRSKMCVTKEKKKVPPPRIKRGKKKKVEIEKFGRCTASWEIRREGNGNGQPTKKKNKSFGPLEGAYNEKKKIRLSKQERRSLSKKNWKRGSESNGKGDKEVRGNAPKTLTAGIKNEETRGGKPVRPRLLHSRHQKKRGKGDIRCRR